MHRMTKTVKASNASFRIPDELRAALEAEAAATGRTMSQVALIWLEAGRSASREAEIQSLRKRLAELERPYMGALPSIQFQFSNQKGEPV